MQKVVMNIAHAFIQLSKNWLNHWSRIRVLYTHAHAKAKSPRNGLVYLCWGWKTLENHYFLFWSLCTWSVWQNGTDLSENVILRGILDFLKASVLFNTFLYLTEQWGFWRKLNEILSNIQTPYKLNQTLVLFSFILDTRLLEKAIRQLCVIRAFLIT